MKMYMSIEDVPENYLKHLNQMRWPDGREPTEQEKLDTLNNLAIFVEHIFDKWHGTGPYNRPDYDASKFRESEIARHAREDKMTPQEFFDEAYADFMSRYGQSNIKRHGVEATEEKARVWATTSMERALETREQWRQMQAKRVQEKEKSPVQKRKRTKKHSPA